MPRNMIDSLESLFEGAEAQGRNVLTEPEVYQFLQSGRFEVLDHLVVSNPRDVSQVSFDGPYIAKIVSPEIIHKSDFGGVKKVQKREELADVVSRMLDDVPRNMAKGDVQREQEIRDSVAGVMVSELWDGRIGEMGGELLVGAKSDDAFGPTILFGLGGTKTETYAELVRDSTALYSPFLPAGKCIIEATSTFQFATGQRRGFDTNINSDRLWYFMQCLGEVMCEFSDQNPEAKYVIEEFEINPLLVGRNNRMMPVDGYLRFRRREELAPSRPLEKLDSLLDPESVIVVGASASNSGAVGNIILRNFADVLNPDQLYVINPGAQARGIDIEGIKAYASLGEVIESRNGKPVDLVVLATKGTRCPVYITELAKNSIANATIVTASGLGETEESRGVAAELTQVVADSNRRKDGGVVLLGPNTVGCEYTFELGQESAPCCEGEYATKSSTFMVPYKCGSTQTGKVFPDITFIAQSGGEAVANADALGGRVGRFITIGNQMNVTAADCLERFGPDSDVIAMYLEGCPRGEGLHLAKVARDLVAQGKHIILRKGGISEAGAEAVAGHTGAIAGNFDVLKSVLTQSGVYVLEEDDHKPRDSQYDLRELVNMMHCLGRKGIISPEKETFHFAGLSNAGFEKTRMVDVFGRHFQKPHEDTIATIRGIYSKYGVDFMDVNQAAIDLTAMGLEDFYIEVASALADDPNVDALVCALTPNVAGLRTVNGFEPGNGEVHDIYAPNAFGPRIAKFAREAKIPVVVSIESGTLYEPVREIVRDACVPVFGNVTTAGRLFREYMTHCQRMDKIMRAE